MKKWTAWLLAILLMVSLAACGKQEETPAVNRYASILDLVSAPSGQVAGNGRFNMLWDDSVKALFIEDTATGQYYGTTPYEYYYSGETGPADTTLYTGIVVEYADSYSEKVTTTKEGNPGLMNGRIIGQAVEGGFQLTYCFDDLELAVPVRFLLRQDSFEVRLINDAIVEEGVVLQRVTLAPCLASVKNDTEGGYLFVPSGSGALMSADTKNHGARSFMDTVYGEDPTASQIEAPRNAQPVRLPVFGATTGVQGLLGIIEKGAEYAAVTAAAGDKEAAYATIGASFQVRGSDTVYQGGVYGESSEFLHLTKERIPEEYLSVGYYPLAEGAADYVGMAQSYAAYLEKTAGLARQGETPQLFVELMGGALARQSFLGFPYESLTAATTFSQAQAILKDIEKQTGVRPITRLLGFGDSGIDPGKVGGGFSFAGRLGGKSGYAQLAAFCGEHAIPLFPDFDLVQFRRSGGGYFKQSDSAQKTTGLPGWQYVYSPVTLGNAKSRYTYGLLARGRLNDAADDLLKAAERLGLDGLSLDTLGRTAYSDFRENAFGVRGGMGRQVTELMQRVKAADHSLLLSDPNDYAAVLADYILSSPATSGAYDALDEDVPFYQIVFRGRVPLSLSPINTGMEPQKRFLKSLETGSALCFSLTGSYHDAYTYILHSGLNTALYEDNRKTLADMVNDTKAFYEAVNGSRILRHSRLAEKVYFTEFEGGVWIITNYTDAAVQTAKGEVEAGGFLFGGKGGELE